MSPKGIGAFYGASTPVVSRQELPGYSFPEEEGSLGFVNTTVPLSVVDLRELPEAPSLFDAKRRHLRRQIRFLHGFVEDLTQVADATDHQNLDYIPTQFIAETFPYGLAGSAGPVAGVLRKSTNYPSVTSCVLFIPSEEVADAGSENPKTRLVLDPASVGKVAALP